MIRQVSAFIQNQEGCLAQLLKILSDAEIDIRSLTIAETADYGVIRLILVDTDKALAAFRENHIMANETGVMAAEISDKPGGMYFMVKLLTEAHINIEYSYSFLTKNTSNAIIIFKIAEDDVETVERILTDENNIALLTQEELMMK